MAIISWKENDYNRTAFVNITTPTEVLATGNKVTIALPPVSLAANGGPITSSNTYKFTTSVYVYNGASFLFLSAANTTAWVKNNTYAAAAYATPSKTYNTSDFFSSANPTQRTIALTLKTASPAEMLYEVRNSGVDYIWANSQLTLGTINLTLDVPPTATVSAITYDKPFIYAGLTTASITVSDTAAYYGGTITDVTFRIGAQTASAAGDGTLSIALDTAGTFTPTVTVTDSRGQTYTEQLAPITVLTYSAPTVSFTAERTTAAGAPDDEGTYATCPATFIFSDVIATAVAPSVILTDENGTQTTPTVTWYSSRAADGTLSGSVTWSSLASGDTVYASIPGLNTNYSYQISIRPRDSQGTGTAITQTVSSAFYTVDFLAGGHGIAFGKPASNVGFECAMDATFEDTLTAQDMTAQEVQDFIDSLNVGGGGIADDLVIEEGTNGDWTYRKWSSGVLEQWYFYGPSSYSTSTARGSLYSGAYITCTFPIPYISQPLVFASGSNSTTAYIMWAQVDAVSSTGFNIRGCSSGSINNSAGWMFSVYAKGRWKL